MPPTTNEPKTVDDLHARYRLARHNMDAAGALYAQAVRQAEKQQESAPAKPAPIRIEIAEMDNAKGVSVEVLSTDINSVTITSSRAIETRALLRAVTEVMSEPRCITVEQIMRAVCKEYGVTKMDLKSHRRTANLVRPRHVVAFLSRSMTDRSFPEIGRRLGNRDHTSILRGYRKMLRLLETDTELQGRVAKITAELGGANEHTS